MRTDPWLDRWLPLVVERVAGTPVLELGCGGGEDSETLVSSGLGLVALDLSERAVAAARTCATSTRRPRRSRSASWARCRASARWRSGAASHSAWPRASVALLIVEDARGVCGTVQLVIGQPENQPHRADLSKLLVHRRARRQRLAAGGRDPRLRPAAAGGLCDTTLYYRNRGD